MTTSEIRALRLHNQKIIHSNLKKPHDVVAWLGAVQAQDLQASLYAIGLRIPGATETLVEKAIEDRSIVRGWLMRATIHHMPAEDALWMTRLLSPRQNKKAGSIYRKLDLADAVFTRARAVLEATLANGPKMRSEIYTDFTKAGIDISEGRGLQIIKYWGQEGLLCIGPRIGKQQTFALLDTWVKHNKISNDEEGFAILAQRYFQSHGPATLTDFTWWTGATKTEAHRGLEAVKHLFTSRFINGQEYFFSPTDTLPELDKEKALLLPAFDEYTVAYTDRSAVIDTEDMKKVYYGINPNVVIGGEVVGTWKRIFKGKEVHIQILPFARFSAEEVTEITKAADHYAMFLDCEAVIE